MEHDEQMRLRAAEIAASLGAYADANHFVEACETILKFLRGSRPD